MSSTTIRYGIHLPAADGSELVNVAQDLNGPLIKIDAEMGFPITTALPSNPASGKTVAVSAAGPLFRTYFHNGTTPVSAGWIEIPNSSGTFDADLKLGSSRQLIIGSDVNLFRSSANVLRTNDSLTVDGNLSVSGIGQTQYVRKVSDQTINSTTLGNDTTLLLPVVANGVYELSAIIYYSTRSDNDFKMKWELPAGGFMEWLGQGLASSATGTTGSVDFERNVLGTTEVYGGAATDTSAILSVKVDGTINVSSTPGNLQLTWAKNANSDGTPPAGTGAIVRGESYMVLRKVA